LAEAEQLRASKDEFKPDTIMVFCVYKVKEEEPHERDKAHSSIKIKAIWAVFYCGHYRVYNCKTISYSVDNLPVIAARFLAV